MKFPHPRPLALGAALLAAGLATASLAQTPPPAPRPPAEGHMMGGRMDMDPAERAAKHAERLRTVLQLRPDQEPALQRLMSAMKPPGDLREKMRERHDEMARLTTPQRLDRMRAHMAERQAAFDQRAAAIKTFYAGLSPSQQKAFDAMGPMHGGRMGGGHVGHGGMGRHGMDHGGPDGPGPQD